ncbi:MAG TPA: hypothetical protein VJ809_02490 [Pirellulales bacterium]|nr:hypothetical protein [Pirellulales bacterium]
MDQETIKALIQKYKAQIDSLNVVVSQLEMELGQGQGQYQNHSGALGEVGNQGAAKQKRSSGSDPLSVVADWQFFNKSQPEAAEQLLEMVGHPLTIGDMLDGLDKGGLKVGGKTGAEKKQNLATVLGRSGRFGRAARGTWGLPTWPNIKPVKLKSERDDKPEELGGEQPNDLPGAKVADLKPS